MITLNIGFLLVVAVLSWMTGIPFFPIFIAALIPWSLILVVIYSNTGDEYTPKNPKSTFMA